MTTAASAVPTASDCNKNFVAAAVLPASDAYVTYVSETSRIIELSNAHLANIGVELIKPPADFTDSAPVGAKMKILPPAPAALFMVLTGFLCISLVNDRRLWLAALAGLLWAGQTGIQAIPQLAAYMSPKKHIQQESPDNTACLYRVEDCCRLRSDIEGTKYIGLLHRLAAIPACTMSLPLSASLSSLPAAPSCNGSRWGLQAQRTNLIASRKRVVSVQTKSKAGALQFAITHFSSLLKPAIICPAVRARQYICFPPTFIFQQLSRGPPNPGPIIVTSFLYGGPLRAGLSVRRLM
jgi:hypothetical protein